MSGIEWVEIKCCNLTKFTAGSPLTTESLGTVTGLVWASCCCWATMNERPFPVPSASAPSRCNTHIHSLNYLYFCCGKSCNFCQVNANTRDQCTDNSTRNSEYFKASFFLNMHIYMCLCEWVCVCGVFHQDLKTQTSTPVVCKEKKAKPKWL